MRKPPCLRFDIALTVASSVAMIIVAGFGSDQSGWEAFPRRDRLVEATSGDLKAPVEPNECSCRAPAVATYTIFA